MAMLDRCLRYDTFTILVIILFLATSGFPSFLAYKRFLPLLLPVLLYRLYSQRQMYLINNICKALIFIGIFVLFHYILGHMSIAGSVVFCLYMATIFTFAALIQDDFYVLYTKVMKVICYISLLIWLLLLLIPNLHPILTSVGNLFPQMLPHEWIENTSNPGVSLYVYYLPDATETSYTNFIRNNGPFFEPGLFASYITIALAFNVIRLKQLLHKDNYILILTLLSTCSSAGYISLILIVLLSISFKKTLRTKLLYLALLVIILPPIMELDFMSDKIMGNMEGYGYSASSRFGAIIYHYEKIIESPLLGYAGGNMPMTRLDRYLGGTLENRLSPNGLSYCFVFWGIPLALLFYVMLYKGVDYVTSNNLKLWQKILMYVIILSTAFSQTITTESILLLIASFPILKLNNTEYVTSRSNSYL